MIETHPELKTAEGGAWSTREMLTKGIAIGDLTRRRRRFQVAYWRDRFGGFHYPKWQFDRSMKVRPEVAEILAVFRTHDTMRVLSWFVQPVTPGRKSLLDLIRAGRGDRAVAIVRQEEERNARVPPLSKAAIAELDRRVKDLDDPTRYVIASAWTRKHVAFYDIEQSVYVGGEIRPACLFRRRADAEAVYLEERREYIGGFPGSGEQALTLTSREHAERWVAAIERAKTMLGEQITRGDFA